MSYVFGYNNLSDNSVSLKKSNVLELFYQNTLNLVKMYTQLFHIPSYPSALRIGELVLKTCNGKNYVTVQCALHPATC